MTKDGHKRAEAVDELLAGLPDEHVVASRGTGRLVIGSNGGFVVVATGDGGSSPLALAARRAGALADQARSALATRVGVAPFLDSLVVSAGRRRSGVEAACVVPLDLLRQVLIEGPPVVKDEVLDRIGSLLERGDLPGWVSGIGEQAAMIASCQQIPAPREAIAPTP